MELLPENVNGISLAFSFSGQRNTRAISYKSVQRRDVIGIGGVTWRGTEFRKKLLKDSAVRGEEENWDFGNHTFF